MTEQLRKLAEAMGKRYEIRSDLMGGQELFVAKDVQFPSPSDWERFKPLANNDQLVEVIKFVLRNGYVIEHFGDKDEWYLQRSLLNEVCNKSFEQAVMIAAFKAIDNL